MKYMAMRNWFATVWSVLAITFLKDLRRSKTMKTAATVTQCLIANINILQFYGRFMLAALLEMFYRIPQKDTGKFKSFLWQQKERK